MIDSVLLIRPWGIGKKEFPVGLLYVGTALEKSGYKVKIIDLQDDPSAENKIIDILSNSENTMLGISALSLHYRWLKNFTLRLKEASPKTKILVGGHISVIHNILLKKTGTDFVCLGEGEELFPELIEKINRSGSLDDILGLAYKVNENIIKTGRRQFLKNFLIPNYDLVDVNRYVIHPSQDKFFQRSAEYGSHQRPDDKLGVIMFSRGCVGACTFCYRHLPGFRQESVEWSWNHLLLLREKYGIKYFRIDDELFTNNPVWLDNFCEKLKDLKGDILFRVGGLRVDLINGEQLKSLKEVGCIGINYGIESGSQKILDKMNKRTTVAQNLFTLKQTLDHGIQTMAYMMLGYEGEDKKTLSETLSLILDAGLSPESVSPAYTIALPGTRIYDNCLKSGKIKNEEEYLENCAPYIEQEKESYERYILNLSDVSIITLRRWEKLLPIFIKLNKKLKNQPKLFKMIRSIIFFIPANPVIMWLERRIWKSLSFLRI
ncbi:MAG: radical SAM protein [Patescibacteria group bacterium]